MMISLLAGFALGSAHFGLLDWSLHRMCAHSTFHVRVGGTLTALSLLAGAGCSPAWMLVGMLVARQWLIHRGVPWS
ncbi:MAG: hypothetical protein AB1758_03195 [Candidatus Eremiobacterota bacterium]